MQFGPHASSGRERLPHHQGPGQRDVSGQACQRIQSDSFGQASIDDGFDLKRGKLGGERQAVRRKGPVSGQDATSEALVQAFQAECPCGQKSCPGCVADMAFGLARPASLHGVISTPVTGSLSRPLHPDFEARLLGSNCEANRCHYVSYGLGRSASIQAIKPG